MAAHIAQRLSVQEQEIRLLNEEIGSLLELGLQGNLEHSPNPALEQLRAENEKLKYRILHLQRSLRDEQARTRPGQGGRELGAPGLKDALQQVEEQHNNESKQKSHAAKVENSVGGKQSACQGKGKNEKKTRKEVDGLKQEDDLTEHASSIILVRLDEHRDVATQEQLENLSDPNMPTWLHKHDRIMYKSPTNTWKILYQDPLPDKYLLYLKRDNTPVKFSKDTPTKLHPLSHHLLK